MEVHHSVLWLWSSGPLLEEILSNWSLLNIHWNWPSGLSDNDFKHIPTTPWQRLEEQQKQPFPSNRWGEGVSCPHAPPQKAAQKDEWMLLPNGGLKSLDCDDLGFRTYRDHRERSVDHSCTNSCVDRLGHACSLKDPSRVVKHLKMRTWTVSWWTSWWKCSSGLNLPPEKEFTMWPIQYILPCDACSL